MQLNVVVDGRPLVGNRTGIGVHTAEIVRRLGVSPAPLVASHAPIDDRQGIEHCRFRVDPTRFGVAWQQRTLARIDADVVWGPHGTLPVVLRKPAVVTMHDFSSLTMPGRHRLKTILSFNLFIARSLALAGKVACVSRAVAEEAVRWFGVPRSKIELVPNGVDAYFSPGPAHDSGYLLFVGTLEPRKGLEDLVSAWWSLPRRPRHVLCGGRGWKTNIAELPGIEFTGFVDRERLRELYRGALAFVYPSRYEGFGIPPLEAMACGAPTIATRTGAIPDYARDAALLVDPGDRQALRSALVQVIGDGKLRGELRARGPERAKEYDWDRSAELMTGLLAE
ncbi:MAG TPA: glycosyltransferase family 1 protein, partial [Thermoanaerobaculia bacterium]